MKLFPRPSVAVPILLVLAAAGGGAVYAQLDGAERGIPPIDSMSSFEVLGVEVDVTAESAEEAREQGWRNALGDGWKMLWARTNNRPISQAPELSESVLSAMVSGVIIEHEQIGPRRYVARLGVLFDRARTGQLLGVRGLARRSAAMLVIPVMQTGGTAYSFEFRNEWQRAWARFRTVGSPIDYVRPSGAGADPLLLNAMQAGRRSRGWWRMLLDQYGAADIIVPHVDLRRLYPGGPAIGIFTARHGPDNEVLGRFELRAPDSASIPAMLDQGVQRLDAIYARALEERQLRTDPSLNIVEPELIEAEEAAEEIEEEERRRQETIAERLAQPLPTRPVPVGTASAFSIRVETPEESSIQQAEISVSGVDGVTSAITTTPEVGGTSTMRVTFVGDAAALAAALQARGWSAEVVGGNTIRISR